MADSYHIIDGKVVPYSGGRKCNDTDAWRDATPLELQLQEQLEEYECTIAAQEVEIEALRAEVAEWKRVAAAQAELHDEAEARAEQLSERLKGTLRKLEEREQRDEALLRQSLKALERGAWDTLDGRSAAAAIRERLEGEKNEQG